MNFTREPIIETIISPKEGFKLVVRNSKSASQEEFSVDALELVSFGSAQFYRSLERPQCFLLPVSDYEVMEEKETRVVLKNAHFEKNIKIGGGKEPPRMKERSPEVESEEGEETEPSSETAVHAHDPRVDRKRDRRRNRRKRHGEMRTEFSPQPAAETPVEGESSEEVKEEVKVYAPVFTGLIPPPTTLISETIARYRETEFITDKPAPLKEVAPEPTFPAEDMEEPEENPGNSIDDV